MKDCKVKVSGVNLQSFLNTLLNRKMMLRKITMYDDFIIFHADLETAEKIKSLFANSSYEIEVEYPKYKTHKDMFYKNLGGLLAIILVCFSTFFYSSSIWQYRIYGLEKTSMTAVEEVLKQNGAKIGTSKKLLDLDEISRLIVENIDSVALASANIVGTTLIITLSENINNTELLDNEHPIISQYDCVIKSITTKAGTALVKVGDKVAKGQTLVANYVVDELGTQTPSKALAEIEADVYYSYNRTFFETEEVLTRTNKVETKNSVDFLFLPTKAPKSKYKYYETENFSYYLDCPLPIRVNCYKFYELAYITQQYDLSDENALKEQAKAEAIQKFGLNSFDNEIIFVSNNENSVTISVSFVVSTKIA